MKGGRYQNNRLLWIPDTGVLMKTNFLGTKLDILSRFVEFDIFEALFCITSRGKAGIFLFLNFCKVSFFSAQNSAHTYM